MWFWRREPSYDPDDEKMANTVARVRNEMEENGRPLALLRDLDPMEPGIPLPVLAEVLAHLEERVVRLEEKAR